MCTVWKYEKKKTDDMVYLRQKLPGQRTNFISKLKDKSVFKM